ncbi:hypothetical protein C8J57DRAFT_1574610 [Mycena rebaudengoi]|nr:hypothetical protein C8J57DRAFT_1574610 [Mycena rebaudengoi]
MTVKLLKRAFGKDQTPLTEKTFFYAVMAVKLTYEVHMYGVADGPFGTALLSHGLACFMTSALCRIDDVRTTAYLTGPSSLQLGLSVLHRWLPTTPGFPHFAQAIEAGLLRLLVSCAIHLISSRDHVNIFLDILPGYMVYHSVLVHMEEALLYAEELAATPAFTTSSFYAKCLLTTLARSRLEFLHDFESPQHHAWKACDNMEISVKKSASKTSSGVAPPAWIYITVLRSARFWTGRQGIAVHANNSRLSDISLRLTTRDRSFMRALVHGDYLACRTDILMRQSLFLSRYPHIQCYTSFDYTKGAVKMQVSGVPNDGRGTDHHEPEWVARWEDQVQRVLRSNASCGAMDGWRSTLWGFVSEVSDGVRALAGRIAEEMRLAPNPQVLSTPAQNILVEDVDELLRIAVAPIH